MRFCSHNMVANPASNAHCLDNFIPERCSSMTLRRKIPNALQHNLLYVLKKVSYCPRCGMLTSLPFNRKLRATEALSVQWLKGL